MQNIRQIIESNPIHKDPPTTLEEIQKKIDLLSAETKAIFSTVPPVPKAESDKAEVKVEDKAESDAKMEGTYSEDN